MLVGTFSRFALNYSRSCKLRVWKFRTNLAILTKTTRHQENNVSWDTKHYEQEQFFNVFVILKIPNGLMRVNLSFLHDLLIINKLIWMNQSFCFFKHIIIIKSLFVFFFLKNIKMIVLPLDSKITKLIYRGFFVFSIWFFSYNQFK